MYQQKAVGIAHKLSVLSTWEKATMKRNLPLKPFPIMSRFQSLQFSHTSDAIRYTCRSECAQFTYIGPNMNVYQVKYSFSRKVNSFHSREQVYRLFLYFNGPERSTDPRLEIWTDRGMGDCVISRQRSRTIK